MGLEGSVVALHQQLLNWRKLAQQLSACIDSHPKSHCIADQFSDAVQDALGWIEECILSVVAARTSLVQRSDLVAARRQLSHCQTLLEQIATRTWEQLHSYERLNSLWQLGNSEKRRSQWRAWVEQVQMTVSEFDQARSLVQQRLTECWQEFAERGTQTNIVINNSNVNHPSSGKSSPI